MGYAFLTGWSLPAPFFSSYRDSTVIDSTELVSSLFDKGICSDQFDKHLLNWFNDNHSGITDITAFSLGAILAIKLAQLVEFKSVTLLAPTLSFISRPDHPSGINPRVLKRMIRAIDTKCDIVLRDFDLNCGIEQIVQRDYSPEILKTGLQFLQNVNLSTAPLLGNPEIKIVHATDDQIIPMESGQRVAELLKCSIESRTGGHVSVLK